MEKSVHRIAVLHHEACHVMTNYDPEGLIFLSYPSDPVLGPSLPSHEYFIIFLAHHFFIYLFI